MRYRKLGTTGLDVSVIGFGASPLGNVFGDVSLQTADAAVAAGIECGINLFDVSPYYGLTLAEERLGQALEGRRKGVLLATKCGRYGAEQFDFSAETITRDFEQSLRRLRTDHVDLLQAHDVEFGDVGQLLGETIPAMQRLKQQGKVRFIGVTGYWPGMLTQLASKANVDCVLNYCHANLFVNDMDRELVPFAEHSGVGLLNASPLHMGLLGNTPVPAWHPAPQAVRDAAAQVRALCDEWGVNTGTMALSVSLAHRGVASTLVGISSEAEVRAACDALDWASPQEFPAAVQRIVAPVHNIVWSSGLQQNQDVDSLKAVLHDAAH